MGRDDGAARQVAVTGSASGLGAAIRQRLEDRGVEVIGVDLHGAEVVADLSSAGGRAGAVAGVLERSSGVLDGLVVCAGLGPHLRDVTPLVRVNFFGAVDVAEALRPALEGGRAPAAVAIASNSIGLVPVDDPALFDALDALDARDEDAAVAAATSFDGSTVYATTKIALARWVRTSAAAWGAAGVRLNAVAPGPVRTPLLQGTLDDPVLGQFVDVLPVPLGHIAVPEEVAPTVTFLLGPDAAYVHGAVLFADGGTDAVVRPHHV